jgi:hypothetical protein
MFTRCPLCQQDVPNWEYQNHLGQHGPQAAARLPVQMMPAPPAAGPSVAPGVPNIPGYQPMPMHVQAGPVRHYYHPQCGGSTAMPPHAMHQMSADPFAFGDKVTCAHCGKQVAEAEIFWSDSGQSLADYRQELKNNYVYSNKLNPEDFEWDASGPVRRKSRGKAGLALAVGGIAAVAGMLVVGGIAVAAVVALLAKNDSPPAPRPAVGVSAPAPNYSGAAQPRTYTPPPVYTAPSYPATPSYTPPSYPSGMQSPEDIMTRHRRESEQRMKESRERMEQMQRDMKRRMDDLQKRSRRRP